MQEYTFARLYAVAAASQLESGAATLRQALARKATRGSSLFFFMARQAMHYAEHGHAVISGENHVAPTFRTEVYEAIKFMAANLVRNPGSDARLTKMRSQLVFTQSREADSVKNETVGRSIDWRGLGWIKIQPGEFLPTKKEFPAVVDWARAATYHPKLDAAREMASSISFAPVMSAPVADEEDSVFESSSTRVVDSETADLVAVLDAAFQTGTVPVEVPKNSDLDQAEGSVVPLLELVAARLQAVESVQLDFETMVIGERRVPHPRWTAARSFAVKRLNVTQVLRKGTRREVVRHVLRDSRHVNLVWAMSAPFPLGKFRAVVMGKSTSIVSRRDVSAAAKSLMSTAARLTSSHVVRIDVTLPGGRILTGAVITRPETRSYPGSELKVKPRGTRIIPC